MHLRILTLLLSVLAVLVSSAAIFPRDTPKILKNYGKVHEKIQDLTEGVQGYSHVWQAIPLGVKVPKAWDAVAAITDAIKEVGDAMFTEVDSRKITEATEQLKNDALGLLTALDAKHEKFKKSGLEGQFAQGLNGLDQLIADLYTALKTRVTEEDALTCEKYYLHIQKKYEGTRGIFLNEESN